MEHNSNDLEVMIWLYCQDSHPIGNKIECINQRVDLKGVSKNISWEIFSGRGKAWRTVTFVLQQSPMSESNNISLNISKFINIAGYYTKLNLSNYVIMGIELGNEFGNENLGTNISQWILNQYTFFVGTNRISMIASRI